MNPQSVKNPLDRAKFREQYLSNLRLQASNDQKNQNANIVFKNTGQTPSRPPDTRTTTERASDIEALKVDLRSKLNQITDGVIASQIIGELTQDQIRFAVDKWGTIEPDMRRQFSTGVPTSAFIAYLNRLIQKFQLTEGVETGLQQFSGNSILLSNTQILYGLPRPQIWNTLKGVLDKARRQFGININPIEKQIDDNIAILPTIQEQEILDQIPPELKAEVITIANRMYNNVASNGEIADIIQELSVGLANRDKVYTEKAIQNGIGTLALDESVLEDKNEILFLLRKFFKTGVQDEAEVIEGGDNKEPVVEREFGELFPAPKEDFGSAREEDKSSKSKSFEQNYKDQPRSISQVEWNKLGHGSKNKKIMFLKARLYLNPNLTLYNTKITNGKTNRTAYKDPKQISERLSIADLNSLYDSYMGQTNSGLDGNGLKKKMTGNGLPIPFIKEQKLLRNKIEKPYRQSITHLIDKPIDKPKPYTQFGRYFINKQRLEGEGIVAFRQPSGNTIPTLPSEKISTKLGTVIKTLVGKGIPSYEDIAALSREEKNKLHHICKTCKVDSPAIPKMKGEGEQEEDRFNILRGEIIAGNDSPKIAKEFKVMLMKFMNEGRIPKRQANEILQELLALGH